MHCRFDTTEAASIKSHRYEQVSTWAKHLQILKLLKLFSCDCSSLVQRGQAKHFAHSITIALPVFSVAPMVRFGCKLMEIIRGRRKRYIGRTGEGPGAVDGVGFGAASPFRRTCGTGDPNGREIGHITYSDHGYSVGAVLATAHIQKEFSVEGVEVSVLGKSATVARKAFFDPDGLRLRS